MRKIEELVNPNSCLQKANPHEMLFVLLGRDRAASHTIRYWVEMRLSMGLNQPGDSQIVEALQAAIIIDQEMLVAKKELAAAEEGMLGKISPTRLNKMLAQVNPASSEDSLGKVISSFKASERQRQNLESKTEMQKVEEKFYGG